MRNALIAAVRDRQP